MSGKAKAKTGRKARGRLSLGVTISPDCHAMLDEMDTVRGGGAKSFLVEEAIRKSWREDILSGGKDRGPETAEQTFVSLVMELKSQAHKIGMQLPSFFELMHHPSDKRDASGG